MSVFAKKSSGFILLLVAGILASQFQPASAQSSVDAVIHYVEGTPSETDISYNVKAYVSVVDGAGSPVNGLTAGDFTLVEDSQQVEIGGVSAAGEPISLVLLIDTSGSMSGSGITAAKSAAASFVTSLGAEDRVAVVTFNDNIATVVDFTTDHQSTRDRISLIDATRGAGTCLYDAAYQAIQMTATVPSGRRAVVLFTDGVDETASGGPCSANTADDVIELATEGGTRTPVYTMGMGSKVDQNSLKRIATNTGGRFFYSPDSNSLDTIFRELSDSLRSQYLIEYSSQAGPGSHTLAVTVKSLGAQDTDTRSFLLPNFPLRLSFAEPAEDGEVTGLATVRAEIFGQGETIESVVFQISGATVATVTSTPYEAQIDFSSYPAGALTIEVIAQGAGGIELARASRSVEVIPGEAVVVVENDPLKFVTDNLVFILGGLLLLGVAIVFGVVMFVRKQNENRREREWKEKVEGVGELTAEESFGGSDRTVDSWEMPSDAYGRLTVLASDDESMVNQHFDIISERTTLGRKADNDIVFLKDSPVSRHHAMIEVRNGGLFLMEMTEQDEKVGEKPPTYGTFVNENKIGREGVTLQNGDEIRLGKRVRLRFEAGEKIRLGDDVTMDSFTDDTMDTQMQ
jgi:Ca-activated chloride channel family protein